MLKEALRLYGPVVAVAKEAAPGGVTLSGYHIPAGTQLMVRDVYIVWWLVNVAVTIMKCPYYACAAHFTA